MEWVLRGEVGPSCQNQPDDVKLVRGLVNIHRRKQGEPALPVIARTDPELFTAIARFQVKQGVAVASSTVTPGSSSWRWLLDVLAASRTVQPVIAPAKGGLTWDAEGQEGGRYHSRILHVPSASSGLTVGRGYDLRERSRVGAQQHFVRAGLDASRASVLSGAVRKRGQAAKAFVLDNDLLDFEITPGMQQTLFEIVYDEMEQDVRRICGKQDVVTAYGAVDWSGLDSRIRDVLVDLRFRGDYTGKTRRFIQGSVTRNDLKAFSHALADQSNWPSVPADRFRRRQQYLA